MRAGSRCSRSEEMWPSGGFERECGDSVVVYPVYCVLGLGTCGLPDAESRG